MAILSLGGMCGIRDAGCRESGAEGLLLRIEFVFHFNKKCGSAHKWVETQYEDLRMNRKANKPANFRQKDGSLKPAVSPDKLGQPYKVPDSVIRVSRAVTSGSILVRPSCGLPCCLAGVWL